MSRRSNFLFQPWGDAERGADSGDRQLDGFLFLEGVAETYLR